ncbi:MAG: ABC transporter permease, partial [Planctomycetota bacterium]
QNKDQEPILCSECILVVVLTKADGKSTNVLIRGVSRQSMEIHAKVQLENTDHNRMLEWGKQEIIIGRALSRRLQNATPGNILSLGKLRDFKIVGAFDALDSSFESEIWMDEILFRDTFSRESYQSVLARLRHPSDFDSLKKHIAVKGEKELPEDPDPRLKIYEIIREQDYYKKQSEMISGMIFALGIVFSVIMSSGAISGAMNTMYSSIRYRRREVGTLLSLGFTPFQVKASFILESMLLALLGGFVGCLFALPVNGIQTGTANWSTFSESTFSFQISFNILISAIYFSLVMGYVGGFFPAKSASQMNVIQALRRD